MFQNQQNDNDKMFESEMAMSEKNDGDQVKGLADSMNIPEHLINNGND